MTLDDIRKNLYRRLNFGDSPDTAVATRITMLINQRHRSLLTSPALRQLREGFLELSSVASQPEYGLPFGINRIKTIRETANDRTLGARSWDWYRSRQPDPAAETGTPDVWVPMGYRAILRRPNAASLFAASASAADVTQVLTTEGLTTTIVGQVTAQSLLTGTIRVPIGGSTYLDVFSLSLSAACAGAVSIFDAAVGGNTLAVIPAGKRRAAYYMFALSPTPASALTYSVDFEHALVDLANTWDQPQLPEDFHDLLIYAVLMDEYAHRDDSRYEMARAEYRQRLSELKVFLYGHRAATQPMVPSELAPLGPWFPSQYS